MKKTIFFRMHTENDFKIKIFRRKLLNKKMFMLISDTYWYLMSFNALLVKRFEYERKVRKIMGKYHVNSIKLSYMS